MEDKELAKEAANQLRELKSDVGMIEVAVFLITKLTEKHSKDCDCLVCYEMGTRMPDSMKFMFVEAKKRCTKPKEAANA